MQNKDEIVQYLGLKPHPEGGFYKETYRSEGLISNDDLNSRYKGKRNYATCIYFLLSSDNFSAFHRIKQDEIWHFYKGSPISLHIINSQGHYQKIMIGSNIERGEIPQFVVKGGDWFASEVADSNSYALAGCTVSPGFDFVDFEMAEKQELIQKYPDYQQIINKLTR